MIQARLAKARSNRSELLYLRFETISIVSTLSIDDNWNDSEHEMAASRREIPLLSRRRAVERSKSIEWGSEYRYLPRLQDQLNA